MARYINVHSRKRPLEINEDSRQRLEEFLVREIEDAISSRHALESLWRELMRQ